jgi:SAM-dependent methyltransferase
METYYARRAAEYEQIYHKPERQTDLARMREDFPAHFAGKRVLEIACGTGYWTPLIAARAESVLAMDFNEETLEIARSKAYPRNNVRLQQGDAYALPQFSQKFSGCLAGFWWSHIPLGRIDSFLRGLTDRLERGATLLFHDNRYVEGNSTPLSRKDAEGNTYQTRRLRDGSSHEVLKNYPTRHELEARFAPYATSLDFIEYDYYWAIIARINPGRTT